MLVGAALGFTSIAAGNHNKWLVEEGARGSAKVVDREAKTIRVASGGGTRNSTSRRKHEYYLHCQVTLENGQSIGDAIQVSHPFYQRAADQGVYAVAYDPDKPTDSIFVDDIDQQRAPSGKFLPAFLAFMGGAVALVVGKMQSAIAKTTGGDEQAELSNTPYNAP